MEKFTPKNLSPEEMAKYQTSRTVHDASLIEDGAEYVPTKDGEPMLEVPQEEIDKLKGKMDYEISEDVRKKERFQEYKELAKTFDYNKFRITVTGESFILSNPDKPSNTVYWVNYGRPYVRVKFDNSDKFIELYGIKSLSFDDNNLGQWNRVRSGSLELGELIKIKEEIQERLENLDPSLETEVGEYTMEGYFSLR